MNPKLLLTLSSVPLFGYALLFTYAIIAFFSVGHWPSYGNPDPKQLEMPIIHAVVAIGMLVSILTILIIPFLLGFSIRNWSQKSKKEKSSLKRMTILFILGAIIWITDFTISISINNRGLFDWYAD